ncbi:MAG: M28 family peptidase [Alphaproteobacteria bacterium]|nr:M28 family peptidase [Alphaproteobacteria bacterium]|tara:strand:- start:2418 stop:3410 length:993 start_codon:yes stop_codon:yes gene_type:complete
MKIGRAFIISEILLVLTVIGAIVFFSMRDKPDESAALTHYQTQYIDGPAMLNLTETLSSDALQGRRTGTEGADAAMNFILKRYETIGLEPVGDGYKHPFPIAAPEEAPADTMPEEGVNVLGWMPGKTPGKGPMLVITAHYDHLGVIDGEIYNGADDNASGVAAMIAVAEYFKRNRPTHDVVFAALDGEEMGLQGARALVASDILDLKRVALNINLDMVSRSEAGELYVAGTYHMPALLPLVEEIEAEAPVSLKVGHDQPDLGPDDWTMGSDHGAFYKAGIPFLYFGVEDHAGYHQPSDDYVNITHDFFLRAGDTITLAAKKADVWIESNY